MAANRVALYASVGPELTHYDIDVEAATLTRRGTVTLPAHVHYCWPHASRPILYAASSDSASGVGGFVGSNHHVTALAIDKASGALSDKDVLRSLLADSVSTFCILFRHALILRGSAAAGRKREVIEQARAAFGIDPLPFTKLLDLREGRIKPRELEPAGLLDAYLKQISVVIDAVDRLEK